MKNKKNVIIFILIGLLLISAIIVNFIAINGKNEKNEDNQIQADLSTDGENIVDNNVVTEEDLELTGEKYIAAEVKDTNNNDTTLEAESDKPMILVFWNTSNANSTEALKVVQSFYEKYNDKVKFNCVAVINEVNENNEKVENFMSKNNITIPVMYDTVDNSLTIANNITKIPTILMINKNAEIINTLTDEINEDIIEANLDILSENY